MAQPYKGLRRGVTVRLTLDLYAAAARAAKARRWNMSEFVAYCVERELGRGLRPPSTPPSPPHPQAVDNVTPPPLPKQRHVPPSRTEVVMADVAD